MKYKLIITGKDISTEIDKGSIYSQLLSRDKNTSAKEVVEEALSCATYFSGGVSAPFNFVFQSRD